MKLTRAYNWESLASTTLEKIRKNFCEEHQRSSTHRSWKINGIQYVFSASRISGYSGLLCRITKIDGTKTTIIKNTLVRSRELTEEDIWNFCYGSIYSATEEGRWFPF